MDRRVETVGSVIFSRNLASVNRIERNEFDVSCVEVSNNEIAVAAARKVFPYFARFYSKHYRVFTALNFRYDVKFNIFGRLIK